MSCNISGDGDNAGLNLFKMLIAYFTFKLFYVSLVIQVWSLKF